MLFLSPQIFRSTKLRKIINGFQGFELKNILTNYLYTKIKVRCGQYIKKNYITYLLQTSNYFFCMHVYDYILFLRTIKLSMSQEMT